MKTLHERENRQLKQVSDEINSVLAAREAQEEDKKSAKFGERLRDLGDQIFAPLTSGLYFPGTSLGEQPGPVRLKEPFVSAFILSDASAEDLTKLGVKVRSQAGDIFTALIPLSKIEKLEASPAIRFIELARPLFPTLDQAVPYAQINTLHTATPPVRGNGVIVGVIDSRLDIYHPDFRTATGATRVLFLWDQFLSPTGTEAGPPTASALPGFMPAGAGGSTYGVEYNQATINTELNHATGTNAYLTVRHGGSVAEHGTHVTGIAAGNGLGQAGTFTGAAPEADIIFVSPFGTPGIALASDNTFVLDAFSYIFARAAALGQPCVINLSSSDNQGPHDGTTLGEQFLDNLLLTPGRAITLSAGNSNQTAAHAAGNVPPGGTANLVLNYQSVVSGGTTFFPTSNDDIEIWYDGHDRFNVTVTAPTTPATVIGPVAPGATVTQALPGGAQVVVTSIVGDGRNGDNLISIIINRLTAPNIPLGDWNIALSGSTVINGSFRAWVDRNNRGFSAWQPPFLRVDEMTLGVPATAKRPITVGNHNKVAPTPAISSSSGRGPTRDGRIKPEIAAVGSGGAANVIAPRSRNMNAAAPGALYVGMPGTSMSAPLVAGACALLFQCRGAATTQADLKQILENTAGTTGLVIPSSAFGFGFLQMATACTTPAPSVDVWLRDHPSDTGIEPFTGPVAWLSPDIEIMDRTATTLVPNPTHHPTRRFNNVIRVTVRNLGTQRARNTVVYLYWADPATNIPFPAAWNSSGICTGGLPDLPIEGNKLILPQLMPAGTAGDSIQCHFGWAPPVPGSNLHGDDHFCLLVRLENESDPSQINVGGWTSITAKNNIALHNVHVQEAVPGMDSDMSFYVVGSADQDSLIISSELPGGQVALKMPVQALPWRDIKLIEQSPARRAAFGCGNHFDDPLARLQATLHGEDVGRLTDIAGAEVLDLRDGVATVTAARNERLFVPQVRVVEGVRMPVSIRIIKPKLDGKSKYVHVSQYSGGRLIGGVTLELRPAKERKTKTRGTKR
jgi:subtilisin family serine protease